MPLCSRFLGRSQPRRAWKTRTSTIIWRTWLSMYEASLCGSIMGADGTRSRCSVTENRPRLLRSLGVQTPTCFGSALAWFLRYCQRERMTNAACVCWVMYATHIKTPAECRWQFDWRIKMKKGNVKKKKNTKWSETVFVLFRSSEESFL